MAKLKGPLFSLGASQQLGKALVFFAWKGLNVVREYVIPANPKTDPQTTQRGYLTAAVAAVHLAMADATKPLVEADTMAYGLWASAVQSATTWFNQVVRNWLDQMVAGKQPAVYRGGSTTPGGSKLDVEIYSSYIAAGGITVAEFKYGTSKTALINTRTAAITVAINKAHATISGLTKGVKYYWQLVPTTHADFAKAKSGIYYGTPT